MSHDRTYFPREITVGKKRKRWSAGHFIGNLPASAKFAKELRAEQRAGNYSRVPKGATVRRFHGNVNVYTA